MKRTSIHQDQLAHPEKIKDAYYPTVHVHTASHGTYDLEGRILTADPSKKPDILMIHGARSDFTKGDALIIPLHDKGLRILNATTSGHGIAGLQSDIPFSLDDNLAEAYAFSKLLQEANNTIIGFSMGGTTAVRLIQQNPQRYNKLVLFYPAVFTDTVYSVPFGTEEFREGASGKGAFLTSSFFDVIKTFHGKIMLIKGEYDGLDPVEYGLPESKNSVGTTTTNGRSVYSPIPPEVFSKIRELRPDTEFLEVPGADHLFAKWLSTHPRDVQIIVDALHSFIVSE